MCASVCARERGGCRTAQEASTVSYYYTVYTKEERCLISQADNVAQAAPDQLLILIVFILRS